MRRHLALLTLVLGIAPAHATPGVATPQDPGDALAERLLAAMGGREAWASVTFVHVEAVHDDLDIPDPFVNLIRNDLSQPRVRFAARNERFDQSRRIDASGGVRETGPEAGVRLTVEQYESDRAWWEGNVYRTFHRMARRDPSLRYRAAGASRLEVLKPDGSVLNWFLLNQKGVPMLFGSGADARGTVFGPLASSGSVKYPKWGGRADGSWRYEIVRFVASSTVPPDTFPEETPPR